MAYCFYALVIIAQAASPASSLYGAMVLNVEIVTRILPKGRKSNAHDQITDQHSGY